MADKQRKKLWLRLTLGCCLYTDGYGNCFWFVCRFVATPSGVFLMFPGTLLNKEYDPTKRMWYRRAAEYPGKVTLTAPYLDTGGAGYIVTISHTIYEGK